MKIGPVILLFFMSLLSGCCAYDDEVQSIYVYDLYIQLVDPNGTLVIRNENGEGLYDVAEFFDESDVDASNVFILENDRIRYQFPQETFNESSVNYYVLLDNAVKIPFSVSYLKRDTKCNGVLIENIVLKFDMEDYYLEPFEVVEVVLDI